MNFKDANESGEGIFAVRYADLKQGFLAALSLAGDDDALTAREAWEELSVQASVGEYLRCLVRSGGAQDEWLNMLSAGWLLTGYAEGHRNQEECTRTPPDTLDRGSWGQARCAYLIRFAYEEAQAAGGLYSPRMDRHMMTIFLAHMRVAFTLAGFARQMLERMGYSEEDIMERMVHAQARGAQLFSRSIVGQKPSRELMH